MVPRLIIHGGAGLIESPDFTERQYEKALRKAIKETYSVLLQKGSRQAVLYGIRLLEDDPLFNAGYGSRLQKDGRVRMSAAIMDSVSQKFSGVINICNVRHPIDVADTLSKRRHAVLAGRGATEYARRRKMEYCSPLAPHRLKEHAEKVKGESGTVGIVAVDHKGCICAGTSTGGVGYETPGRVSDSATVAGTYASRVCGVSCTGQGESIVNQAVAAKIVARVEDGVSLASAVQRLVGIARQKKLRIGLISLDCYGNILVGNGYNTKVLYAKHEGTKIDTFLTQPHDHEHVPRH
ncbi:MAG: isoaspartyl peptidase/L-asparaginase [Candidatus Omnitrophota bacterium]|nr:isoaspartyl peptidase/L-asparaginase [Candidatus Omnitrophota bacterium]